LRVSILFYARGLHLVLFKGIFKTQGGSCKLHFRLDYPSLRFDVTKDIAINFIMGMYSVGIHKYFRFPARQDGGCREGIGPSGIGTV
jgi:hypothetical protein